jgi:hypothetical protein
VKTETLTLQSDPDVTLTTYLLDASAEMPNAAVRPAVLVFPGGSYRFSSDRAAEPIAMAFVAKQGRRHAHTSLPNLPVLLAPTHLFAGASRF